jgi:hypothetical protein
LGSLLPFKSLSSIDFTLKKQNQSWLWPRKAAQAIFKRGGPNAQKEMCSHHDRKIISAMIRFAVEPNLKAHARILLGARRISTLL